MKNNFSHHWEEKELSVLILRLYDSIEIRLLDPKFLHSFGSIPLPVITLSHIAFFCMGPMIPAQSAMLVI